MPPCFCGVHYRAPEDRSMYYCYLETPIGDLLLAGDEEALCLVGFPEGSMRREPEPDWIYSEKPFGDAREQLSAYFAGERKSFDLNLKPGGTEFQMQVLEEWCRKRTQSDPDHHSLPPGHRQLRRYDRIRRRNSDQGSVVAAGTRTQPVSARRLTRNLSNPAARPLIWAA